MCGGGGGGNSKKRQLLDLGIKAVLDPTRAELPDMLAHDGGDCAGDSVDLVF
jgi:NADP-dependent 3-hydroxy acid dehydrogenase YdfG